MDQRADYISSKIISPVQSGGGVLFVGCFESHCADGGCDEGFVGVSLVFGVSLH